MNIRPVRTLAVGVVGIMALLAFPSATTAAPVDDLRAQAEALEAKLNRNGTRVAEIGEQLDAVQGRIDQAEADIADAEDGIQAAEAEITRLQDLIARQAAALYVSAGSSNPLDAIHAEDITEAGTRSQYAAVTSARDEQLIDELDAAQAQLETEQAAAESARNDAAAERDELSAARDDAQAAADEQQGLLDQVQGELQAELQKLTEERLAQDRVNTPPPSDGGTVPPPGDGGGFVPSNGGGGGAAAYAQAQVGNAGYCNDGNRFGPSCFDCSGLVHMAWKLGANLTIPTVSGSQYAAFAHRQIPLSELQPGDLVTTSSWGGHIAIWVGNGYVHATNPSDNAVRFVSGTSDLISYGVRPG